ncbi:hypothetical protein ACGFRB_12020 [Streptomyces sp. NPDC048718]
MPRGPAQASCVRRQEADKAAAGDKWMESGYTFARPPEAGH